MHKTEAKEWSITLYDYCIGIARNNIGGYCLVIRYPISKGGLMNTFISLFGKTNYQEKP